jgi:hypothetical protein
MMPYSEIRALEKVARTPQLLHVWDFKTFLSGQAGTIVATKTTLWVSRIVFVLFSNQVLS